ncbi:unnamed protein product [Sphagnum balticum]
MDARRPYPGMQHQTMPCFYGYKNELIVHADATVYCALCIQKCAREGSTKGLFSVRIYMFFFADARPAVAYPKSKSTAGMLRHIHDHHKSDLLAACVVARREMCTAATEDRTRRRRTTWAPTRVDTWTLAFVSCCTGMENK